MPFGELLEKPGDWYPRVSGARADQCHGGVQRVAPIVVGSPPGHLVEQVGFEATAN